MMFVSKATDLLFLVNVLVRRDANPLMNPEFLFIWKVMDHVHYPRHVQICVFQVHSIYYPSIQFLFVLKYHHQLKEGWNCRSIDLSCALLVCLLVAFSKRFIHAFNAHRTFVFMTLSMLFFVTYSRAQA